MVKRLQNIYRIITSKPFDTSTETGREKERNRRIALTAITAAISRVLSTIIPFITVKISLDYLGVELYGLWNAVISFFALFVFADLGLGNGLQTFLSRAYGQNNKLLQDKIIFNSYLILCIIAVSLTLVYIVVSPFVNWQTLLNVHDLRLIPILSSVVLAIIIPKLATIPLSLIQRVQLAYQEGYNSNLWQCFASILSLVGIIVICNLDLGQLSLIWWYSLIPLIVFILNSIYYFRKDWKRLYRFANLDIPLVSKLLKNGMAFFLLSILTTSGLAIDTFIVAHVGSLSDATPYSILHKVAYTISIVVSMLCSPLWPANGEALARGDKAWVRKNTLKISRIAFTFAIVISTIILIFAQPMFQLWLGQDFHVSIMCLSGMCVTQIILSAISPYFMVLNASNVVKKQIYIFTLFTGFSLALKFIVGPHTSVNIIPWINNICYLIFIVPFVLAWSREIVKE